MLLITVNYKNKSKTSTFCSRAGLQRTVGGIQLKTLVVSTKTANLNLRNDHFYEIPTLSSPHTIITLCLAALTKKKKAM